MLILFCCYCLFFFKQKTAYEMRISDWSSDVCSSDLEIMIDRRFGDAEPRSDVVERRRVKTALVEEVNSCSKHGFLFGIACLVALRLAGEWRLKIGHSLSL